MKTRERQPNLRLLIFTLSIMMLVSISIIGSNPNHVLISKNTAQNDGTIISSALSNDPVVIDGDEEFEEFTLDYDWAYGSGTESDPYTIDGLNIDANGAGTCLVIKNINGYFKIKECVLEDSGENRAGLLIYNCKHAIIINNEIKTNGYGLIIRKSSDISIMWNVFTKNVVGVFLDESTGCGIAENYFIYSETRHLIDYSKSNTLYSGGKGNYWTGVSTSKNLDTNYVKNFQALGKANEDVDLWISRFSHNLSIGGVDLYPIHSDDSDGDGLSDLVEILYYETDHDQKDSDGDKIDDGYEVRNNMNPLKNDASADNDIDGLTNLYEYETEYEQSDGSIRKTDPNDIDSDNDGFNDGDEITKGTDPTNPYSHETIEVAPTFSIPFGNEYLLAVAIGVLVSLIQFRRKFKRI